VKGVEREAPKGRRVKGKGRGVRREGSVK